MDAVAQLLNAQSAADECAAWTSLLHQWAANDQLVLQMAAQPPVLSSLSDSEASAHQQQSPPVLSSMLEEFLLFFIAHTVSKVPGEPVATRANHDVLAGFVGRWSPGEVHEGDELARHLANLKGKLTQCQWNGDALHQLVYVLSLLQEPCLRQETLRFSFTIIQHTLSSSVNMPPLRTTMLPLPCESNTQQVYEKCSELMLLGVTDIWSAIRKESAKHTAMLVLQFPTVDAIDGFIERLLRIAVGSEHVRQETSVQTRWGEQDGALHALSLLLSSIRIKKRAVKELHHFSQVGNSTSNVGAASRVASDIRGGFAAAAMASAPALRFSFGSHHPSVPRLPRSLMQSLKPVLYQCLRHEQLSVREQAAQCLKHYVDLCEEPMQLLIFQEAMSKLNRMKESTTVGVCNSSGDDHELLEAFEAEGLLDVLAKLAPSLPSSFLLKHWKFVFPTLERYVMHIASSVRQKSSAVVLSLAKLSQSDCGAQTAVPLAANFDSGSSHGAALELLVEMMLGLSASQGHESTAAGGGATIHCWQQREGRMLSIEALVDLLGKDLLFRKFGAHLLNGSANEKTKKSQAPVLKAKVDLVWASSSASSSAWTLDEDELAELTALSQRSKQADACGKTEIASQPLVSALSAFLTGKKSIRGGKSLGATKFWCRVLSGWLQQTQIAFGSNQFELRRISRQLLPGLLRLSLWTNQLELLQSQRIYIIEESGECWRWSCVKFLLLHVQFLQESIQMHSVGGEDEELTGMLQTGLESAWSLTSAVSKDKLESTGGGSYGTESTTVRVEAQLMTFLSFSRSDGKEISSLGLLESGLVTVHANLPPHMQLPQYITPGRPSDGDTSSLDRQLSISLVRLLPNIARELGLVFTKHNSQGGVASGHEMRMTKCWLILERVVLTWLVTEDMFRWITVDQNEAQLSLLKTLSGLLQCIPAKRSEHFSSLEVDLELVLKQLERIGVLAPGKNQQHRSTESILAHVLRICLSLWKNSVRGDGGESTIEARCCQGVIQVYSQLAALNDNPNLSSLTKSSTSQSEMSSWNDWDEDEYEPGELGNNKTSQLRVTASVDEIVGGGGVAEQLFSDAVSGWSGDQLSALRASISASTVAHTHTSSEKEFRFALGDDDTSVNETSASSSSSSSTSRSMKRQRTDSRETPACVARVRMMELIRELQDTDEHDDTTHYGLFIWPSAMVLARFVARNHASLVRQKVVMEIGCGTGLPGILAAVCGDPNAVFLTDRSDAIDIQRNVEANIALNGIEDVARFLALDWGHVAVNDSLLRLFETVDVLLAADCFYASQEFEKVIASVALIFRCNPKCRLYVTYQLRSITRSIAPLLARWRMQAKALETVAAGRVDAGGDVDSLDDSNHDDEESAERHQQSSESVFLYEIAPLE